MGKATKNSLNMDQFSPNETRIKVLTSYQTGHVETRSRKEKQTVEVIKNIVLKWLKALTNAIFLSCNTELKKCTQIEKYTIFHRNGCFKKSNNMSVTFASSY